MIDCIEVKIPTADGVKILAVRPPSDEEWTGYIRARKIIVNRFGQLEEGGQAAAAAELLAKVAMDKAAEIDQAEAVLVVKTLERTEMDSFEREGACFVVNVSTALGPSQHRLKVPSAKQFLAYGRLRSVRDLGRGRTQVFVDLDGISRLYDELIVEAPSASILARHQAISAVMEEYQKLINGEENF